MVTVICDHGHKLRYAVSRQVSHKHRGIACVRPKVVYYGAYAYIYGATLAEHRVIIHLLSLHGACSKHHANQNEIYFIA